jgi:hypothetical protein
VSVIFCMPACALNVGTQYNNSLCRHIFVFSNELGPDLHESYQSVNLGAFGQHHARLIQAQVGDPIHNN